MDPVSGQKPPNPMVTLEGGKEALEETKPRAGWKE